MKRAPRTSGAGVRFIPLGGLGEIGMNCFALEQDGAILVVDCGVAFPDDDVGVDVVHPDFTWLLDRQERIAGIFITHGHEDHIGALPFLLRELDEAPAVYAPAHACALITRRLEEHELDQGFLQQVEPGKSYAVGPFNVEPIPVAHSIIDATALCIETRSGRILHTGDFDLDEHQPAGLPTDHERLEQLGGEGIRLLLSDSTNVDREERSGSEADVAEALAEVIESASRRVVIGMFSSNIHRLKAVAHAAHENGRKLCLLGRSLNRQLEAVRGIGRLELPPNLLIQQDELAALEPERVLVVAGGSQGEGPSSLRRLSLGNHHQLKLEEGDRVVLSARVIPGNEKAVFAMTNDLLRLGVEVLSAHANPALHTSGHASRSEQRKMIDWTAPASFIPVHGTLHHLRKHAELAQERGVADCLVIENGTSVFLPEEGTLELASQVPAGITRVAFGGEELSHATRKRRLDLSRSGVATVGLVVDRFGKILHGPSFTAYGIPTVDGDEEARRLVTLDVRAAVKGGAEQRSLPLAEVVRRRVRRSVYELSGVRPVVEVNLIQA